MILYAKKIMILLVNSFVDDFAGSHFYLLGRRAFRAVRAVRLLRAVAQLFYKFLHHLALHGGCSLMFRLLVLLTAFSFSNIWNGNHSPEIRLMVRRIFLHSPINNDKIQVNRYCNAKGEKHEYY